MTRLGTSTTKGVPHWSEEEEKTLMSYHKVIGSDWEAISELLVLKGFAKRCATEVGKRKYAIVRRLKRQVQKKMRATFVNKLEKVLEKNQKKRDFGPSNARSIAFLPRAGDISKSQEALAAGKKMLLSGSSAQELTFLTAVEPAAPNSAHAASRAVTNEQLGHYGSTALLSRYLQQNVAGGMHNFSLQQESGANSNNQGQVEFFLRCLQGQTQPAVLNPNPTALNLHLPLNNRVMNSNLPHAISVGQLSRDTSGNASMTLNPYSYSRGASVQMAALRNQGAACTAENCSNPPHIKPPSLQLAQTLWALAALGRSSS